MTTEVFDHLREVGRWLLNRGFNVVHGHSAHVFKAVAVDDDGLIRYGGPSTTTPSTTRCATTGRSCSN